MLICTGAGRRSTGCSWATRPSTSTPSPGSPSRGRSTRDRPVGAESSTPPGDFRRRESPWRTRTAMELTQVRYEVAEGVATLTLDRPERRNAFTAAMADELARPAAAADADETVRVVVVTGAGTAFCVGADLSGGRDTFDAKRLENRPRGPMSETIGRGPRDPGGGRGV